MIFIRRLKKQIIARASIDKIRPVVIDEKKYLIVYDPVLCKMIKKDAD